MKTVARLSLLFLSGILVSSCTTFGGTKWDIPAKPDPVQVQSSLLVKELQNIEPPIRKPTVAIYSFTDQTGQKRQNANGGTSFSSVVTQAPEVYLIRALTRASEGNFFKVVDRTALDWLTKERQLIRQTRTSYEGNGAKKLPALTFAGMIIAGGIVGYDHSTESGGAGARYLGIGTLKRV